MLPKVGSYRDRAVREPIGPRRGSRQLGANGLSHDKRGYRTSRFSAPKGTCRLRDSIRHNSEESRLVELLPLSWANGEDYWILWWPKDRRDGYFGKDLCDG